MVATREYGQLESKPTGSCANVFRTGIKQDPLIWPPTTGPNGKPQLHNAPHIPEGNPTATAAVDGNGVLGDIDCTSGAVTDAHGDGICLRKVSGKLQIQRYWHNFMCTFQLNDDGRQQHMSKAAFSQKTADPGSVSGNGLDGTLYLPE